jgi:hypothetical protein
MTLLLLTACIISPTTLDTGGHNQLLPVDHFEAPALTLREFERLPSGQLTADAHSATSDPCDAAVVVDPSPYLLGADWSEINGPINAAEVDVGRCRLTGAAVVYELVDYSTVWVNFCDSPGSVVAYTSDGHCFGVVSSPDAMLWGAYTFPGMLLTVQGGQYTLEAL